MRALVFSTLLCLLFVDAAFSLDKANDCKCRIQASKRMIGGRDAEQTSFPWQISVMAKDTIPVPKFLRKLIPDNMKIKKHKCGGVVLNERYIMTYIHCIPYIQYEFYYDLKNLRIGVGDNDLVRIYEEEKYVEIESMESGPGGITLLKLKNPLKFSKTVQPACLPSENQEVYEGALQVSGWGAWEMLSDQPTNQLNLDRFAEAPKQVLTRYLKEAEVLDKSSSLEICRDRNGELYENLICTENAKNETACDYDKGGPLHYVKGGKAIVVGVMRDERFTWVDSKPFRVCTGQAEYARVGKALDWIKSQIGDDYCS